MNYVRLQSLVKPICLARAGCNDSCSIKARGCFTSFLSLMGKNTLAEHFQAVSYTESHT